MEELKQVVRRYAAAQADHDGVVLVPAVPGLRMVCVEAPRGLTHTFYRPLVCLVLQGAKRSLAALSTCCRPGVSRRCSTAAIAPPWNGPRPSPTWRKRAASGEGALSALIPLLSQVGLLRRRSRRLPDRNCPTIQKLV